MLNKVLALLESVTELEKRLRLYGNLSQNASEAMMRSLLEVLKESAGWRSKYSRTITGISEDLNIAPEKPGSGVIPDTSQGKTGGGSSVGESSSRKE